MNPREKKLVIAVVSLLSVGFAAKVIVPKLRAPLFGYDTEIARLEKKKAEFAPALARLDAAMGKFKDYTVRSGGNDENDVADEFGRTLNDMLLLAKLTDKKVNPKEPATDKKTGLVTLSYSVSAQGGLRDVVEFIKSFYETPYIARFRDLRIVPNKSPRGGPTDIVKLSGSIDVLVPPKPDTPVPLDPGQQPAEGKPKYRARGPEGFALIHERDPFNAPEKPKLPVPPVLADKEPVEPLIPDPQPPQPSGPARDPEGAVKMVRMCMAGAEEEILVFNTASKHREFVAKGKDIDGGKLLMVHPLGALVRRMDAGQEHEFLYPIGGSFIDSVRIDQAQKHPELRTVARYFLKEERKKRQADQAAAQQSAAEQARREAAARVAAGLGPDEAALYSGGATADGLMGPPAELGEPRMDPAIDPYGLTPVTDDMMGPPAALANGAVPSPARAKPPASAEPAGPLVGPPTELAGPRLKPSTDNSSPPRAKSRRPRVNRPGGSD